MYLLILKDPLGQPALLSDITLTGHKAKSQLHREFNSTSALSAVPVIPYTYLLHQGGYSPVAVYLLAGLLQKVLNPSVQSLAELGMGHRPGMNLLNVGADQDHFL